ncbi:MAG: hypothetical protein ACOY5B_07955 [Spirochaetota bacterium]
MLAVFDFLVMLSALFAFAKARRAQLTDVLAALGFLLIAGASGVGTIRYAGVAELKPLHQWASALASVYGVPAIAAGFFLQAEEAGKKNLYVLVAVILLVPAILLLSLPLYSLLIGICAQLIWIVAAVRFQKVYPGIPLRIGLSVAFISVAGLVFAGEGSTLSIRNENWFHGLLAAGIVQQGLLFARIRQRV